MREARRGLALTLWAVALASVLLVAPAMAQTDTTQPPAPTAPPTAPPDTEAPTTTAAPTDSGDDELDTGTVVLLIILGLAIAAIIGAVVAGRGRSGDGEVSATVGAKRDLLANVRWLHDQLSIHLLGAPGPQASVQWQAERYRVQQMAATAQGFARGEGAGTWERLAVAINDVIAALDTATTVRADPQADPAVVSQAIAVANQNRALLMQSAELAGRTIA